MRVKAFAGRQRFCHLKAQTPRSFGQFIAAKLFFHGCSPESISIFYIFTQYFKSFEDSYLLESERLF
jgi:hypothetical protein